MLAVMAPIFITIPNLNILQLPLHSNQTKPHCTGGSPVEEMWPTVEFPGQASLQLWEAEVSNNGRDFILRVHWAWKSEISIRDNTLSCWNGPYNRQILFRDGSYVLALPLSALPMKRKNRIKERCHKYRFLFPNVFLTCYMTLSKSFPL